MKNDNLTIAERMLQEHTATQKDRLLESRKQKAMEMFNKMVILINQEVDLPEFKYTYFPDEDRTLDFRIEGMEDIDSGFVFEDGKVRTIRRLKDQPTCIFKCSEDTFLRLVYSDISFASAYFWDLLKISGDNAIRDYEIFKRMFNRYGYLLKKIRNGK